MIKNAIDLINETVEESYLNGVTMFLENLEIELNKDTLFETTENVEDYTRTMFENEGIDIEDVIDDEEIDEEKLDEALEQLEAEAEADEAE